MVMIEMTAMSLSSGLSSLKKNANTRTNASVDDLHSASHINQPTKRSTKQKPKKLQRGGMEEAYCKMQE
jgi:hypothetical protein